MAKSIPEEELAAIEAVIRESGGAQISDLVSTKATQAERRAVHRRLKKLLEAGRIISTGGGRSTSYQIAKSDSRTTDQTPVTARPAEKKHLQQDEALLQAEGGLFVPLSKAGQELHKMISRPRGERGPSSYQRDFLEDYEPNRTYYLSDKEREYLESVGAGFSEIQPAGTYVRQILNRLLIDLAWNSSRLEGNTYSILDTYVLLDQGQQAKGKSAQDAQMILNHKEAIEFLVESADEIGFNRYTILNLHGWLSNNLLDSSMSGRLREERIGIGQSDYMPVETPAIIEECFNDILAKAEAINDPFEQSFFVMVQLPALQPFVDVNKRVSRLAANIPFIRKNLGPLSFIDVPQDLYIASMLCVYEFKRTELARDIFIWAYERSSRRYSAIKQSLGEPDPFRIRYREAIRDTVTKIIRQSASKEQASREIEEWADANMTDADKSRFIEVVGAELVGLHDGNFARYKVRPSEFYSWKKIWEG